MDFFQVQNGPAKIARDLTANAILMSTSKYVKDGPQPVGTYKPNSVLPQEKYGARKLKTKSEASEKKISESSKSEERPQVEDFVVIENQEKYSQSNRGNFVQIYMKTEPNEVESPSNRNIRGMNINSSSRTTEIKEESKVNIVETVYQNASRDQNNLGRRTPQPIRYGALQNQDSGKKEEEKDEQAMSQTPQPARYGAQRRIQTQQISQVETPIQPEAKTEKSKLRIETEISKIPDEVKLEPTPNSVQSKIGRQNSKTSPQISAPVRGGRANIESSPVSQEIATDEQSHPTSEFNKETSEGTPTQIRGTLSRNTGRVQFKGKQSNNINVDPVIEPKVEKVENGGTGFLQKKRSNIVLYIIKNLFEMKIKQAFYQFRQNTKSKSNVVSKMFMNKVNLISTKINYEVSYLTFQKLVKSSLSPPIVNRPEAIEKLSLNSSKIVYSLLNKIYIKNLNHIFTRNSSSKVHSSHRNKICYSLNSISKKKYEDFFKKLVGKTSQRFAVRNQFIHQVSKISKSFYSKIYQSSWRKLRLFNKTIDEVIEKNIKTPSKLARSKVEIKQVSPEIEDKGMIEKIEKEIADNNKNLQDLNRIFEKEKIEYRNKLTLLGKESEEFQGYYEEKSKQNEELKERLSSLEAPEENYIEDSDLLIETKFPILYELFLKVEKSNGNAINIDDLARTLTVFEDEMKNDELVNQWLELEQNCWLKKKINQYEGSLEHQRKAAKMVQDEESLLADLVAGYIKEKYAWEWVKNALASVSLTA